VAWVAPRSPAGEEPSVQGGRHRRGGDGRFAAPTARAARAVAPTALVAVTLVACTTASSPPAPPTARVQRADVITAVSSSGSLTSVTEQNLGFVKGGQLKTVNVKVGQRVTAGEVLAAVDDAAPRRVLEQQQGQLDSQRAALARLVNATTVQGATNTTNQAQEILSATEDQTSAQLDADDAAVDRAQDQLDFDQDARDEIEDQLNRDTNACAASGGTPAASSSASPVDLSTLQASLSASGGSDSEKERHKKIQAALKAAGSLAGSLLASPGSSSGSASGSANAACTQAATDRSALVSAERQVEASKTALDVAQNKRDVDEAAGRVQVENARQGVVSAQNNLDAAQTDRPSLIAQQQGIVTAQAAIVRQAQQDVADTVLKAPADGTVSAVNGAVGEFLTAGSGTTALAPGSEGPIPGTGATSSGTGTTGGGVSRPGGTQFIVLDNVDRFEVVVPFEEADAVRITPNQRVDVRFDSIPDLTRSGTVVAVSPAATALSGVISYYVTVALTESDPRLRNGLTAQAGVVTQELRDVLAVLSSAVKREGDKATVTVLGFDGPRTVTFVPGLVGDELTQVVSGLTAGDEVVVPGGR
jgi:HlyD family secretion protein